MKRISVVAVALAVLCCTVSHAREFNVALGGSVSGEDFGDAFDADLYTVDARYYFDAVSDSDGPYREAAFINPASSIAASYSGANFDSTDNDTESDEWKLRGRYYNRSHGWYVSVGGAGRIRHACGFGDSCCGAR
ncbi:MAG: putative porin [Pseudomonadales bacterium]